MSSINALANTELGHASNVPQLHAKIGTQFMAGVDNDSIDLRVIPNEEQP